MALNSIDSSAFPESNHFGALRHSNLGCIDNFHSQPRELDVAQRVSYCNILRNATKELNELPDAICPTFFR